MLDLLCSVKKEDFNTIFDDFFEVCGIDIKKQIDITKIYKNFNVFKIHLKNPNNIETLLLEIFKHITVFSGLKHNPIYNTDDKKYKESVRLLIKYIQKIESLPLKELKEGVNFETRKSNKWTEYQVDVNLEELSRLREIGEILLFFFIESLLKAPILFSKIQLKTNNQMPVFWNDAIHINKDWNCMIFWESKITNSLENWKTQSRKSLIEHINNEKIEQEISVISNNIALIPSEKFNLIKGFLSPYSNEEKNIYEMPYELTCFIWFEDEDYLNFLANKNEKEYLEKTYKKIENILKYYKTKENKLKNKKITFFLLPIQNIFNLLRQYWLKLDNDGK